MTLAGLVLALLLAPLGMRCHELAHAAVARAFGAKRTRIGGMGLLDLDGDGDREWVWAWYQARWVERCWSGGPRIYTGAVRG